jgi:hypothetical protein
LNRHTGMNDGGKLIAIDFADQATKKAWSG